MSLNDEELVKVVSALKSELELLPLQVGTDGVGESFETTQGTVIRVTQSVSEAIVASIGVSNVNDGMPTYSSVTEVNIGDGEYKWLIEMDAIDYQHELALTASDIVNLADSIEQIENFDLLDVNATENEWATSAGYPIDTLCRVVNDLQNSLFAYEMSGFINSDIETANIGVRDVDGRPTIIIAKPNNEKFEQTLSRTKASITQLNPNCRSVFKVTLQECVDTFERMMVSELNQTNDMEHDANELMKPSFPVILNR